MRTLGLFLMGLGAAALIVLYAFPAHAAGKPVPRKLTACQAASVHGVYRWHCQRPTLRPTGWDLAGWR